MKVRIVTDSGGGLSQKEAKALDIDYLPLQVMIDEKVYLDGVDLDTTSLYDAMERGANVQTSQPPMGMIERLFYEYEEEGVTDVVLVTLSSGLSGTNENVCAAAKRHDLNIHTFDVYSTLAMEKAMAQYAKALLDQGLEPEQIIERLKESVDHSGGYLIVEDLQHLVQGGRLTPMAAKLGGMLKIKPILKVSKETKGQVDIYEKVRTMSKALKTTAEIVAAADGINAEEYDIVIMDSRSKENADVLQQMMEELIPGIHIERQDLCAVINCHTGMGSIGIQYIKKI